MSWQDQLVAYEAPSYRDSLYHHGIKGQKWGVRRFRNEDGSVTPAGKKRYGLGGYMADRKASKEKIKRMSDRLMADDDRRATKMVDRYNSSLAKTNSLRKSGQISRKEARAQRKAANKQLGADAKRISDQYVAGTKRIQATKYSDKAKRLNKLADSNPDNILMRGQKDANRNKAKRANLKAEVFKAEASGDKSAVKKAKRASRRATAAAMLIGDSNVGSYERYRKNGAGRVKAAAKVVTGGHLYRK